MSDYPRKHESQSDWVLPSQPSPELYREIFTHSNDAIAIIDSEARYLEQNAAHRAMMGYEDHELYGHTPAIHLGEETFKEIARQLAETGEYRGEVISRTKFGEMRQVELSAFAMQSSRGDPICYVGIKRDISERKRQEEALRRSETELTDFFENAAVGLHWVGPNGYIIRVNQAELALLGYTREDYIGHHISEFHADRDAIKAILEQLHRGEELRDHEVRLRCKDGSIKYACLNSSAYFENGKFIHTRCFTRDITDRKQTEQRLYLQYAITRILSESNDVVEAARGILRAVCENLNWQVGVLWRLERESDRMVCVDLWRTEDVDAAEFELFSRTAR